MLDGCGGAETRTSKGTTRTSIRNLRVLAADERELTEAAVLRLLWVGFCGANVGIPGAFPVRSTENAAICGTTTLVT